MTPLDRLRCLRDSLSKARDCEQEHAAMYAPQYLSGLRSGLDIAIRAIIEEIKWAERAEQEGVRHE